MKVLAAYLLASLNQDATVDASAINKILAAVGIEADSERVDKLVSELEGKSVQDLIAEGASKLASVPTGGAVAASSGAPAAGGAAAAAKEEEKKEEVKEESDDDMGFGLFD
ncbi:60s acidic ribosomal protein-domain-containing protein [Gorgonomyces haynaldii]|nr:60s acidic ribosomal protein-domain-containing protein [Gorgonomyces haynaldii]